MKLYKHKNYKEYLTSQNEKNRKKINSVFVTPTEIQKISEYIKSHINNFKFGICHGVRNGWEVKEFRKNLDIKIIGTDIADTAKLFLNIIEWDFHNIKDEWINNVDFIYSNSFDHSYNPELCINQWLKCIKPTGFCFVQWSESSTLKLDAADCFTGDKDEYKNIFEKNHRIVEILEIDNFSFKEKPPTSVFVIKRKSL